MGQTCEPPCQAEQTLVTQIEVQIKIDSDQTVTEKSVLLAVVDKTRDSTASNLCPVLLTLIAHVESSQILLFVESLVLSTTIFTTINTYYTHNFVYKMYIASIIYAFHTLISKVLNLVLSLISYLICQTILK